jgi:hypothetical protein
MLLLSSLALLPLASACGGSPASPQATTCPIPAAVAVPTFSGHVLPVLRLACGADGALTCHGTPFPKGYVSYGVGADEVWRQLVDHDPTSAPPGAGWKRVAPGEVARSWLIEKVTKDDPGGVGTNYGYRMPAAAPNLCDPTVQTIERWIERGAPND